MSSQPNIRIFAEVGMDPWEILEYVGEALVFIGVVGEVFAEWREPHRDTMAKASSVVLVVGLALSLAALIGTNEYFNTTIAGLNLKSSQANERAAKSESAANDSKAESLKLGIELEKQEQRAATAEKDLLELQNTLADRSLTDAQVEKMVKILKPFAGQQFDIVPYWNSPESMGIYKRIGNTLLKAKWEYLPPKGYVSNPPGLIGVKVYINSDIDELNKKAAESLVRILNDDHIQCGWFPASPSVNSGVGKDAISISVGTKR